MSQQIQMGQIISVPESQEEYLVKGKLGQGASGSIYQVELKSKQSQKILPQYAMKVQNFMQSSEEEIIKLLMNSPCDNLLNIRKYWKSQGKFFIIMDLASGGNLYDFMQQNKNKTKLQPQVIQELFHQLCRGVLKLHELNIIHRDLKPENILLSQQSFPFNLKICDYGLSKNQSNACTMNVGTIYYMAPELFREKGSYDRSIDVWALGCIWYSLVADHDLFTGNSQQEVFQSIVQADQQKINNAIYKLNLYDWQKQLMNSMINIDSEKRPKIETIFDSINKNMGIYTINQAQNQKPRLNPLIQQIPGTQQISIQSQNESHNLIGENLKSLQQQLEEMKSEINYLKQSAADSSVRINEDKDIIQNIFKEQILKSEAEITNKLEMQNVNLQQQINQNNQQQKQLIENIQSKTQQQLDIERVQIKEQFEQLLKSDQLMLTQQAEIKNKIEMQNVNLQQQINQNIQQQKQLIENIQSKTQQQLDIERVQIKEQFEQLLKSDQLMLTQQAEITNKLEMQNVNLQLQINQNYQYQKQLIENIQSNTQQQLDKEMVQIKEQFEQLLKSDQLMLTQQAEIKNKIEMQNVNLQQQINQNIQQQKQLIENIQSKTQQQLDIERVQIKEQFEQLLKSDQLMQTQQAEIKNKIEMQNVNLQQQINQNNQQSKQLIENIQSKTQQQLDIERVQIKEQFEQLLKSDQLMLTQQAEITNKLEMQNVNLQLKINQNYQYQKQLIENIQSNTQQQLDKEMVQIKEQFEQLLKSDQLMLTQQAEITNKLEIQNVNLQQQINQNNQQQKQLIENIQSKTQQQLDKEMVQIKEQFEQLLKLDQFQQTQQKQIAIIFEKNDSNFKQIIESYKQYDEKLINLNKQIENLQSEQKSFTNTFKSNQNQNKQHEDGQQLQIQQQQMNQQFTLPIQQIQIQKQQGSAIDQGKQKSIPLGQQQQIQKQHTDFQQNQDNISQIGQTKVQIKQPISVLQQGTGAKVGEEKQEQVHNQQEKHTIIFMPKK